MRVVIAGASGLLGTHLASTLSSHGHEVIALVRREARGAAESRWDPYTGVIDHDLVAGSDAVVNLAGLTIAGNPHSRRRAETVLSSRVVTTNLLARTIVRGRAAAPGGAGPAFIAQNGISWYGDHGNAVVTEESQSHGDAFLTQVTRAWQDAAQPVAAAGGRLCVLRTAPVMDATSAPLKPLALATRLGLGARIGSGEQYFPVISTLDWVRATTYLIESSDVSGVFNLCCPRTPTNAEFTDALAERLGRRALLRVPAAPLRVAAGRMGPELLNSLNARPAALERAGYDFAHDDVEEILAAALPAA